MRLLVLALAGFLQVTNQDSIKTKLAWSLKEGQQLEVRWKGQSIITALVNGKETPYPINFSYELAGTLRVEQQEKTGAKIGKLSCNRMIMKGIYQGKTLDFELVDGDLKVPRANQVEAVRPLIDAMSSPLAIQLTATGNFQPDAGHPLFDGFSVMWGMCGPILPEKEVAPEENWEANVGSDRTRAAGIPTMVVKYVFADVSEVKGKKLAHITMNLDQKVTINGTDAVFKVRSDSLFDAELGWCAQHKLVGEIEGIADNNGQKTEMKSKFIMDFEVLKGK